MMAKGDEGRAETKAALSDHVSVTARDKGARLRIGSFGIATDRESCLVPRDVALRLAREDVAAERRGEVPLFVWPADVLAAARKSKE